MVFNLWCNHPETYELYNYYGLIINNTTLSNIIELNRKFIKVRNKVPAAVREC